MQHSPLGLRCSYSAARQKKQDLSSSDAASTAYSKCLLEVRTRRYVPLSQSTVEFIHRTVSDYIKENFVWSRLEYAIRAGGSQLYRHSGTAFEGTERRCS